MSASFVAAVDFMVTASPPAGAEPLEGVLLSSLPVGSEQPLRQRQAWDAPRWPTAEESQQAEQAGCGEEAWRLETAEAMGPRVGLLSVAAALAPGGPSAGARAVRQFVRGVARLGG